MKSLITIAGIFYLLAIPAAGKAQTDSAKKTSSWKHRLILVQPLKEKDNHYDEIKMDEMSLPPGSSDSIRHQHMAQLTGYILEGTVVTKMKNKPPQTLLAGQAFYEYPGEVHEYLKNNDPVKPAKILLYYLYKKDAVLYQKAAPGK